MDGAGIAGSGNGGDRHGEPVALPVLRSVRKLDLPEVNGCTINRPFVDRRPLAHLPSLSRVLCRERLHGSLRNSPGTVVRSQVTARAALAAVSKCKSPGRHAVPLSEPAQRLEVVFTFGQHPQPAAKVDVAKADVEGRHEAEEHSGARKRPGSEFAPSPRLSCAEAFLRRRMI